MIKNMNDLEKSIKSKVTSLRKKTLKALVKGLICIIDGIEFISFKFKSTNFRKSTLKAIVRGLIYILDGIELLVLNVKKAKEISVKLLSSFSDYYDENNFAVSYTVSDLKSTLKYRLASFALSLSLVFSSVSLTTSAVYGDPGEESEVNQEQTEEVIEQEENNEESLETEGNNEEQNEESLEPEETNEEETNEEETNEEETNNSLAIGYAIYFADEDKEDASYLTFEEWEEVVEYYEFSSEDYEVLTESVEYEEEVYTYLHIYLSLEELMEGEIEETSQNSEPVAPPSGYTTDSNGKMAYAVKYEGRYDFKGFVNDSWKMVTFHDDGFAASAYHGNGLTITPTLEFVAGGQAIKMTYTVKNNTSDQISDFRFYIAADTMVANNDASSNSVDEDNVVMMTNEDNGISFFAFSTTEGGIAIPTEYSDGGVSYCSVVEDNADPSTVTSHNTVEDSAFVLYFPQTTLAVGEETEYTFIVGMGDENTIASIIQNVKSALSTNAGVDYSQEVLSNLDPNGIFVVKYQEDEYLITASEDGTIPLIGTDDNGQSYDFIGKTISIYQKGDGVTTEDSEEKEVEIAERPTAEEPEGLTNTPTDIDADDIVTTNNSIQIKVVTGQEYKVGEEGTWTSPTSGNYVTFTGLSELTEYTIYTRVKATNRAPASLVSNGITVKTMGMFSNLVKANYSSQYDGESHAIVVTTSVSDASISYSDTLNGTYVSEPYSFKYVGQYTIYYCVSKEGYYNAYGVLTANITESNNFVYTSEENKLIATCNGAGCSVEGLETTLVLTASSPAYQGSPISKSVIFSGTDFETFNETTGKSISANDIKLYSFEDVDKETELTEIAGPGTYVAELTVNGKTVTCNVIVNESAPAPVPTYIYIPSTNSGGESVPNSQKSDPTKTPSTDKVVVKEAANGSSHIAEKVVDTIEKPVVVESVNNVKAEDTAASINNVSVEEVQKLVNNKDVKELVVSALDTSFFEVTVETKLDSDTTTERITSLNAASSKIENIAEAVAGILTPEELTQVLVGHETIKVDLDVQQASTQATTEVKEVLKPEHVVANVMDINLFKTIGTTKTKMVEIGNEVAITINVGTAVTDKKDVQIIRNHDGVAEYVTTINNHDGTITFMTDRFSEYVLVTSTEDVEEKNTNSNNSINNTNTSTTSNTNNTNGLIKKTSESFIERLVYYIKELFNLFD